MQILVDLIGFSSDEPLERHLHLGEWWGQEITAKYITNIFSKPYILLMKQLISSLTYVNLSNRWQLSLMFAIGPVNTNVPLMCRLVKALHSHSKLVLLSTTTASIPLIVSLPIQSGTTTILSTHVKKLKSYTEFWLLSHSFSLFSNAKNSHFHQLTCGCASLQYKFQIYQICIRSSVSKHTNHLRWDTT